MFVYTNNQNVLSCYQNNQNYLCCYPQDMGQQIVPIPPIPQEPQVNPNKTINKVVEAGLTTAVNRVLLKP
jgi:hypothetical protein